MKWRNGLGSMMGHRSTLSSVANVFRKSYHSYIFQFYIYIWFILLVYTYIYGGGGGGGGGGGNNKTSQWRYFFGDAPFHQGMVTLVANSWTVECFN